MLRYTVNKIFSLYMKNMVIKTEGEDVSQIRTYVTGCVY